MLEAIALRVRLFSATTAFAILGSSSALSAQCVGQWDVDGSNGLNSSVAHATMWDPDGAGPQTPRMVVAGPFGAVGSTGQGLPNIGAFDPATRTWTGFANGVGWPIAALCATPDGGLYVAVGSQVYVWADPAWVPLGSGFNAAVASLAPAPFGGVLAAGAFTQAGGVAAGGFARWNGTAWSSTGLGVSAVGRTLAVAPNGAILASGRFTLGGVPSERVARWDGLFWTVLGPAFDAPVAALLAVGNTDFVAAGDFSQVGGVATNRIARWSGTAWQQVGSGLDATPYAMAVDGAHFVVGGAFASLGGVPMGYLARWDGTAWQSYREGMSSYVRALARWPNGDLVAAGDFGVADRVTTNFLARWDGQRWQCVSTGRQPLPVGSVRAVLPTATAEKFVGGSFSQGFGLNYVARYDGTSWQAMGRGLNGQVRALLQLPNGDVLAGGDFTATYDGGTSLPYLARWDGTVWSAFSNPFSQVHGMVQRDNGDLFVVGYSSQFGWGAQQWNGSAWQTLGSGPANTTARAVALAPNGDLLMGGDFDSVAGVYTGRVARWNGTTWSSFGNFSPYVAKISVAANGDAFVLTSGNWSYWRQLHRYDANGWVNVGQPIGGNSDEDCSMQALPNGEAVVGGVNSNSYGYLSRYSPLNGWQSLSVNGPVTALTQRGLDELHIGGSFSSTPSGAASCVSRFLAPCPARLEPAGAACAGPNGTVELTAQPSPWIGLTCQSRATGLSTNAFAFVALGVTAINLPLDSILALAAPGCVLVPAPDDVTMLVPFAGEINTSLAVPNNPALAGTTLYQQVVQFELDPVTGPLSLNASNALRLVVGVF